MSLNLKIITPQGTFFEGEVTSLLAPGISGYFGVLPNHAPMVTAIGSGVLKIEKEGDVQYYIISGGLAEINSSETIVLADMIKKVAGPDEAEIELEELLTPSPAGH